MEEEDATLDPACTAERAPPVGSLMTMPFDVRGGGIFGGASETRSGWSVVRCLFWVWVGGGGGSLTPDLGLLLLCRWTGAGQKTVKGH